MILFLISWFLVGFLSIVFACIKDMRGKEFDPNYFNEGIGVVLFLIAFGYISVIIVIFCYIYEENYFTKLIYKIANIGVKIQDKEEK